jgi:hypothetical protein
MTDDTMALRGLLEKSSDADLLREMISFAAHRVMELEMAGLTGAAHEGLKAAVTKVLRAWSASFPMRPPSHA